jgi:hypothetical protein
MRFLSLSDIIDSTFLLLFYFSIIVLTIIKDEHYLCRIRVSTGIRKLFFNKLRRESIPLITVTTAIEFLVTFPILLVVRLSSENLDLTPMLVNYLILPWLCLTLVVSLIELGAYTRKKINIKKKEKIEREKYIEQKHMNTKRKLNVKKYNHKKI